MEQLRCHADLTEPYHVGRLLGHRRLRLKMSRGILSQLEMSVVITKAFGPIFAREGFPQRFFIYLRNSGQESFLNCLPYTPHIPVSYQDERDDRDILCFCKKIATKKDILVSVDQHIIGSVTQPFHSGLKQCLI